MNTKPCGDIPSASSLEYGEIAVNYASGKEAVMLRNTEDAVVTGRARRNEGGDR